MTITSSENANTESPENIVYPHRMEMIRNLDNLGPGEYSYVIDSNELCKILQEGSPIDVGVLRYFHPDNDDLVSVEFKLGMEISRTILTMFAARELEKRNKG